MSARDDDFWLTRDLRRACIHEAAHLVVARHRGLTGSARVWRHRGDPIEERTFIGQCEFPDLYEASRDTRNAVGLAGLVAEMLDDEPDMTGTDFFDWLELDAIELSMTDLIHAGHITVRNINRSIRRVRKLWAEIEDQAGQLAQGAQ